MNFLLKIHLRFALLLLAITGGFMQPLWATHIVGGELNYTYIGNNRYVINLTVYRDCFNGIPPFDNPASLGIFDPVNNLFTELLMRFPGSDTIPPAINSPCFTPPTNICYERTTYTQTVTLPPRLQGYQLAYQRCCRNYTILNIVAPDQTGATYYASIPTIAFSNNSNPVFKNWPPPFICLGLPFDFDHSATDGDGDSIIYEICTPLTGADTLDPMPQPPNAPPYNTVDFDPPYNNNNLIGGVPLTINRFTGQLTCIPNRIGQFVVGICAREFRNGTYLSTTKRDFQLNVVPCPSYVVAAIQNPIVNCRTKEVTFENFSVNAGSYLWNFGLQSTTTDSSTEFSPTFIYPDTGTYVVTLIAYSPLDPNCADTTIGTVSIRAEYEAAFFSTRDTCTNTFSFFDTSNTISGITNSWLWDFDDGSGATIHNPIHQYSVPGNYTVTLFTSSSDGCLDTVTQTINVPPLLKINSRQTNNVRCIHECNGSASVTMTDGNPPYNFLWNDPSSQTSAAVSNLCPGNYIVTVTDQKGCVRRDTFEIKEPDSLKIKLRSSIAYCHGECIGTGRAYPTGGNGGYQFLWSDPLAQQTSVATHLCPGKYSLTLTDSRGCTVADSISILYSDSVPQIKASADTTIIYQGQSTSLHGRPIFGLSYNWSPAFTLNNSGLSDPIATPVSTTFYTVTVTDQNQCINTDTITIIVLDVLCKEPELFIPNSFTPNNDQQNDVLFVRGNTIESMHLAIYDRWGEKVFESEDKQNGWDGTFRGAVVTPGVFVYYLDIVCYNKIKFKKKGNITVIR